MVDSKTILPQLKKLVTELSEDLLARSLATAEIEVGLREAYTQIEKGGRTADPFEVWRDDYLDQVAVAWVLGCVFVRFMEDNHLIDECWLAGEGDRRQKAEDSHEIYFREHPRQSDREYFEHVFREVGKIPACRDLFAEGKTPLWALGPSGDSARRLLKFWQETNKDTGRLLRTFNTEGCDTRFLGDLYQELSDRAKDKYALLQTPPFVEEFILDRTLLAALNEFGLPTVRMIDPTCGSGHFLLGAFTRLFACWSRPENSSGNAEIDAQKALDGVWGVDVNPFAVAIARFRLIVAAAQSCKIGQLKSAVGWTVHLATGDSLLLGKRFRNKPKQQQLRPVAEDRGQPSTPEFWAPDIYACEDKDAISEVLGQQYHAVVGNPPYISPNDSVLAKAYRRQYVAAFNRYHLSAPFAERFFELAVPRTEASQPGFVGFIKDKAFTKREFGKRLIEDCFPNLDITHILDCEGAYIPGHGTPTVIIFGRNSRPVSGVVRAVLGIKGEPGTPHEPSNGLVWRSILTNIDLANGQDEYTSSCDVSRALLGRHPWSIGGGGAAELKERLDKAAVHTVKDIAVSVGITAVTGEDDAFLYRGGLEKVRANLRHSVLLVEGDMVRDFTCDKPLCGVWPYDDSFRLRPLSEIPDVLRLLWPYRTRLSQRKRFGTPMLSKGAKWYEWQELYHDKLATPLSIVWAEVATHNNFALDRGGRLFKNTAPIIKLSSEATEIDHLGLLGCLVSSVVCFWLKQVTHNKGDSTDQQGARTTGDPAFNTYQLGSKRVAEIPVCASPPLTYVQALDQLARQLERCNVEAIVDARLPTRKILDDAREQYETLLGNMIAIQEELDWHCYLSYQLLTESLCYSGEDLPVLAVGERAFEILLARQISSGDVSTDWFTRHDARPTTDIPAHWPSAYSRIVQRRIDLLTANRDVGLIERPEYKRRWNFDRWEVQEQRVLRNWLLDRLESPHLWSTPSGGGPILQSAAELAGKVALDDDFVQVMGLFLKRTDFNLTDIVAKLLELESVPSLPILRFRPSGLRKRQIWETTWELQRKEDHGEKVGEILVPPKYSNSPGKKDYQKDSYWRLRGCMDVSRERWVSYPHCEREGDHSILVGWAGWDQLQHASALVAYYDARKREGWSAEQLKPLLAALDQLVPWIHQWHPEIDPEYNETAGTSFQTLLESEAQELGLTLEQIRNWNPPVRQRAAKKAASSQPRKPRTTRKKAAATEAEEKNDE